jgi:hypothetical protein
MALEIEKMTQEAHLRQQEFAMKMREMEMTMAMKEREHAHGMEQMRVSHQQALEKLREPKPIGARA